MISPDSQGATALLVATAVNTTLCVLIGALVVGVRGLPMGVAAGVIITAIPVVVPAVFKWLIRENSVTRLIAGHAGAAAVRAGEAALQVLARPARWMAAILLLPIILTRLVAGVVVGLASPLVRSVVALAFTPLGVANMAALAVLAVNLTDFDFATPIVFLAFGLLILVLLVNENEAAAAAEHACHKREE